MTVAFLFSSPGAICPQQVDVSISFDGSAPGFPSEIVISLPHYIESNDEQLRAQFLSFVYEVGKTEIRGKSVIQHLQIDPSFSFWWMTLFALRRWHADSGIVQALKLLALEQTLINSKIRTLHIDLDESSVQTCVVELCRKLNIDVVSQRRPNKRLCVPNVLIALATFARAKSRKAQTLASSSQSENGPNITVVDYFNGFDVAAANSGEYRSRFWSDLPKVISAQFGSSQWLHIRDVGKQSLPVNHAEQLAKNLSKAHTNHSAIDLVDMQGIRRRVMIGYFRLFTASLKLQRIRRSFTPNTSHLDLWPIFSAEWHKSLRGSIAIQHLAQFHAMRRRISQLPKQTCGVYLMENQPWEMALISAWNANGYGTLVGIPHAAPKFWEVRRFVDPRSRLAAGVNRFPQPDFVATNSALMHQELLDNGLDQSNLMPVEALAFTHLSTHYATSMLSQSSKQIAVLGDFSETITQQLLDLVGNIDGGLTSGTVFKPHPACIVDDAKLAHVGLRTFTGEIGDLLSTASIFITTSSTSAALEAYCLGKSVIMLIDGAHLNMSPLRKTDDVFFVRTTVELTAALRTALSSDSRPQREFFNLNDQFPLWRAFLTDLSRR